MTPEIAVLHLMDDLDLDLDALQASLMVMNDFYLVVLEWRLNTFSVRPGLECQFL